MKKNEHDNRQMCLLQPTKIQMIFQLNRSFGVSRSSFCANFTDVNPHPIRILKMNQLTEPLNLKQINLTASTEND